VSALTILSDPIGDPAEAQRGQIEASRKFEGKTADKNFVHTLS